MVDIAIAAGIWVVIIYALVQRFPLNKKKQHFTNMLKDIERVVWEKELATFKAQGTREQLRTQYDHAQDGLQKVEADLLNKNISPEKREQNTQAKGEIEKAIKMIKDNMDDVDHRINDVQSELEGTIQLREHVKGFIKYNT